MNVFLFTSLKLCLVKNDQYCNSTSTGPSNAVCATKAIVSPSCDIIALASYF